jgi:hypothetical protein
VKPAGTLSGKTILSLRVAPHSRADGTSPPGMVLREWAMRFPMPQRNNPVTVQGRLLLSGKTVTSISAGSRLACLLRALASLGLTRRRKHPSTMLVLSGKTVVDFLAGRTSMLDPLSDGTLTSHAMTEVARRYQHRQ